MITKYRPIQLSMCVKFHENTCIPIRLKSYRPEPRTDGMLFLLMSPTSLSTTAAEDILTFFISIFSEKIRLAISSELSARQMIHMEFQVLFSLK